MERENIKEIIEKYGIVEEPGIAGEEDLEETEEISWQELLK